MSPHPLPCCPERSPPWSDHRQEKSRPLAEQRPQAARSGRWGPSGAGHWSWQLSGSFGQAGLGGTVFPSETGRRFLGEGSPTWGGRCAEGHRACRHVGAPGSGQRVPVLSCGVLRGLWAFRPWGSAPWSWASAVALTQDAATPRPPEGGLRLPYSVHVSSILKTRQFKFLNG